MIVVDAQRWRGWTIERRQPYGTAGPLQPRPFRWVPWPPAAGLTWARGTDAMRWAIAAANHTPGTAAHAAELRRLATVRDTTIRYVEMCACMALTIQQNAEIDIESVKLIAPTRPTGPVTPAN